MEKVAEGVYSIKVRVVRMFVVDGDEGVTLIDTGLPRGEGRIREGLRSIGRSEADIRAILITHGHADHTGSAAVLRVESGAMVVASEHDAPAVRGVELPPPPPVAFRFPVLKPFLKAMPTAMGVEVDRLVSEGMRVPGGFSAYETPGHTEGHVSYLLRRGKGVLFVGDAAVNRRGAVARGYFNAKSTTIDASIRRLGSLAFDVACFGHSPPLSAARDAFRSFS